MKTVWDFDAETLDSAEEYLKQAAQDKRDTDATAHIADTLGDDITFINLLKELCAEDPRKATTDINKLRQTVFEARDRMLVSICEGYNSGAIV